MGVSGSEPQNNGHLLTPDNGQKDLHKLILAHCNKSTTKGRGVGHLAWPHSVTAHT